MSGVKKQVDRLPFVGDRRVTDHRVVADVGLGDSAGEVSEAEIRPDLSHGERVEGPVPLEGHSVQLAKMLYRQKYTIKTMTPLKGRK